MYKTPPTITKEGMYMYTCTCKTYSVCEPVHVCVCVCLCVCPGLSTVSVSLPYSSVVSVWEQAGATERERRTGEDDHSRDCHSYSTSPIHAGFVEVLEHHVERLLGFKLQVL